MNRGRIFRRRHATTRLDRLQNAAGERIGQARDHARERLVRGREALISLEHSLARRFRRNPSLYLAGGLLLGVMAAAWIVRGWRGGRREAEPEIEGEMEIETEAESW